MRTVLEAATEVDLVALMVVDADRLVVRAAVGIEQDVHDECSVRIGEGYAGRVAAERRPIAVRSACSDPQVMCPAIHGAGVQALYGVPVLHDGTELLGVLVMGSRGVSEFNELDMSLLRDVAERASAALIRQQLRDQIEHLLSSRAEAPASLEIVYAGVPVGLGMVDPDLRFLRVNEELARIFGLPSPAHLGKRISELLPRRPRRRVVPRSA